jgi:hypothetical protein
LVQFDKMCIQSLQKVKDAMEAWEKYHGKFVDEKSTALRVQIVIDADESWITDRPTNDIPLVEVSDEMMDIESSEKASHSTPNNEYTPRVSSITSSNQSKQVDTDRIRSGQDTRGPASKAESGRETKRALRDPTQGTSQQRPLLSRIGALSDSNLPKSGMVSFGAHTIVANPKNLTERIEASESSPPKKGLILPLIIPRGRMKRGPRRLAKYEVRRQQQQNVKPIPYPLPASTDSTLKKTPFRTPDGHWHPRGTTASYLDAEMDQYRQQGLMGLANKG